jgi:hypothetical protein
MILASLAAFCLTQQKIDGMKITLPEVVGQPSRLSILVRNDRLDPVKLSPRKFGDPGEAWAFEYVVATYVASQTVADQSDVRHRVFSQERKAKNDPSVDVARLLARLYDFNVRHVGLDHSPQVGGGVVDVYLCFGGEAGGEQRFDVDYQRKNPVSGRPGERVNTIYIYDLASFTDPTEKLREVAHEYGHATLPPVGGFQRPEDWANGYLGERVYLRWIRNQMASGKYLIADAMGASFEGVEGYVKEKVDPLVTAAITDGPKGKWWGPGNMNGFMGLALAAEKYVGGRAMSRGLVLTDATDAKGFAQSIADAIQEQPAWRVTVPEDEKQKVIWLPTGEIATEGATIVEKMGIWRKLRIDASSYVIRTVRPPGGKQFTRK